VCLNVDHEVTGYGAEQIGMLALIVNELTINAIKHAFEENAGGTIRIALQAQDDGNGAILSVDDDGLPMPDALYEDGLGLMLVRRLACSINCTIVPPPPGTKRFVIKLPVRPVGVDAG
jgi:two-component sensor histidine kinase